MAKGTCTEGSQPASGRRRRSGKVVGNPVDSWTDNSELDQLHCCFALLASTPQMPGSKVAM